MSGGVVVEWAGGGGDCEGGYEANSGAHGGGSSASSGLVTSWRVGFWGSLAGIGGLGGAGWVDFSDFPGCSAEIVCSGLGGRLVCMFSMAWSERW